MYISTHQIKQSLEALEPCHPFWGITFLVCKAKNLPIGRPVEFHADAEELKFMEKYYRPDKSSRFFYRVFRPSDKARRWLRDDYPSSGSQSTRTKRGFGDAFIHERGTSFWGWQTYYITSLKKQLRDRQNIPAFHIAVWLYREKEWASKTTAEDIVEQFRKDFKITPEESRELYSLVVPEDVDRNRLFVERIATWKDLKTIVGTPPDANPEEGGTLTYLGMQSIGSISRAEFSFSERLNLITGDNGLGKTFLLECAWWALTGQWASLPANPSRRAKLSQPRITFEISSEGAPPERLSVSYSWQTQSWPISKRRPTIPGLLVYARVDGSFAVWDPTRDVLSGSSLWRENELGRQLLITKEQVWNGLEEHEAGKTRAFINGLIRDWVTWQNNPERYPYETFKRVLRRLSPLDLGPLEPGEPTRLPGDAREIPTIRHCYGEVPILYAAAGVRRIIALAYLVVWAWEEHRVQSELLHKKPQRRMVILIDEVEAHLHPKWQRNILPALVNLGDELSSELKVQFIVATHSPMVMVSLEPVFSDSVDKLFHYRISNNGKNPVVLLEEIPYSRHGRIDNWLTSEVFELKQARSQEAEEAIEAARAILLEKAPSIEAIKILTQELVGLLPFDDSFWPRWKHFVEEKGIEL